MCPQNVPAYIFTLLSKRGRTAKQAAAAKTAAEAALIQATIGRGNLGIAATGLGFPQTPVNPLHLAMSAAGTQDARMPPAVLASPSTMRNNMIGGGLNFWHQAPSQGSLSPVSVPGISGLGSSAATMHSYSVPPSPNPLNRPYPW